MKTTHTPGPWESRPLYSRPLYSTNDNTSSIFYVTTSSSGRTSKRLDASGAFKHEDARLIAAAPDLLAAIEGMLLCAEMNQDDIEGNTRYLIENARAAIAKARGHE